MNDQVREALVDALQHDNAQLCAGFWDNPNDLERLLRDRFPDNKHEIAALVEVARLRVRQLLLPQIDWLDIAEAVMELDTKRGFTPEICVWAIHSWIVALRIKTDPILSLTGLTMDQGLVLGTQPPSSLATSQSLQPNPTPFQVPSIGWLFRQSLIGSAVLAVFYAICWVVCGCIIATFVYLCGGDVNWAKVTLGCSFVGVFGLLISAFTHLSGGLSRPDYWKNAGETRAAEVRRNFVGTATVVLWAAFIFGVCLLISAVPDFIAEVFTNDDKPSSTTHSSVASKSSDRATDLTAQIAKLKSPNVVDRKAALSELRNYIGDDREKAVDAVIRYAVEGYPDAPEDVKGRLHAIEALSGMVYSSEKALEALIELLADPVPAIRTTVEQKLRYTAGCTAIVKVLERPGSRLRVEHVSYLLAISVNHSPEASEQLEKRCPNNASALDGLVRALAESYEGADKEALRDLTLKIGHLVFPALSKFLKDDKNTIRKAALDLLGYFGKKEQTASVVPEMLPLLNDKQRDVRIEAVRAIGRIGPRAKSALADLEWLIAHEGGPDLLPDNTTFFDPDDVRIEAALARWRLNGELSPLLAMLLDFLKEGKVQRNNIDLGAFRALGEEHGAALTAALEPFIVKGAGSSRQRYVQALGQIGTSAVPLLKLVLRNQDAHLRAAACQQLGKLSVSPTVVVSLMPLLADSAKHVRFHAGKALASQCQTADLQILLVFELASEDSFISSEVSQLFAPPGFQKGSWLLQLARTWQSTEPSVPVLSKAGPLALVDSVDSLLWLPPSFPNTPSPALLKAAREGGWRRAAGQHSPAHAVDFGEAVPVFIQLLQSPNALQR